MFWFTPCEAGEHSAKHCRSGTLNEPTTLIHHALWRHHKLQVSCPKTSLTLGLNVSPLVRMGTLYQLSYCKFSTIPRGNRETCKNSFIVKIPQRISIPLLTYSTFHGFNTFCPTTLLKVYCILILVWDFLLILVTLKHTKNGRPKYASIWINSVHLCVAMRVILVLYSARKLWSVSVNNINIQNRRRTKEV